MSSPSPTDTLNRRALAQFFVVAACAAMLPTEMLASETIQPQTMVIDAGPFTYETADALSDMIAAGMGDVWVWGGRANALVWSIMPALVWQRDKGMIALDQQIFLDHLHIDKLIALADVVPEQYRRDINWKLYSLPGFDPAKGARQSQTTHDQLEHMKILITRAINEPIA